MSLQKPTMSCYFIIVMDWITFKVRFFGFQISEMFGFNLTFFFAITQAKKKGNFETFQPWYFLPDPTSNPNLNWKYFLIFRSDTTTFTYFKITSFLLQRPMHKSWEQRRKLSRVDPCFNSIVFWKKLQRSHFMYSGKINEFCQHITTTIS